MEQLDKKVEGIRKMMHAMQGERYALVNSELVSLDEYTKSLYLKVLCTVIQYENTPSKEQTLFLNRIVNGIGAEESMEDYMRKSLQISDMDIREFLERMQEGNAKYYFALDGLLLTAMRNSRQESYRYLATLIELCSITKSDLEYICLVAESVFQQNPYFYDQAKLIINAEARTVNYTSYVKNYYAGAIVDTRWEKQFSAPDIQLSASITYPTVYREKKTTFSDLAIELSNTWKFQGCEQVIFENCRIEGRKYSLSFSSCKSIAFRNCQFKNFSSYTIIEEQVENAEFDGCLFENCIYEYHRNHSDGLPIGGVIHTEGSNNNGLNKIFNSFFKNCGGKNDVNYYSSQCISNCLCEVTKCKFYRCCNHHNKMQPDSEYYGCTLFPNGTKISSNEIYESVKLIKED